MEDLGRIQKHLMIILRMGIVVYAVSEQGDAAVGPGMAALMPPNAQIFRMRSAFFTQEDSDLLKRALVSGQPVMLICDGEGDFPSKMADFWQDYIEQAEHKSGGPHRHLHFERMPAGQKPSALIVLHLNRGESPSPYRPNWLRLGADELAALAALGQHSQPSITEIGISSPSARAPIAMRDLVMLHMRDPEAAERKTTAEILQPDTAPLTWTDLQTLLQSGSVAISMYDSLLTQKRITEDQYGYALASRNFRREQSAKSAGQGKYSYPDIFEVIWAYEKLIPDQIYRGQFDANWPLETSLFRRKNDGSPLDLGELQRRMSLTNLFLARLREKQTELFGGTLSEDELLAVAQHFGFPTSRMDFTSSFRTAAFFATLDAANMRPDAERIGVIYALDSQPEGEQVALSGDPGEWMGLDINNLAGIHEGQVEHMEPKIPSEDDRIGRQRGLFVKGFRPRDFREARLSAYYFRQVPGLVFEDERGGITRHRLLPAETKIAHFAASVRQEYKAYAAALDPLLGSVVLVEPGVMGSQGGIRPQKLALGHEFFAKLRDACDEAAVTELQSIFTGYFSAARTQADVGVLPEPASPEAPFTPLGQAVFRLAEWAGVAESEFWKMVRPWLPYGNRRDNPPDVQTIKWANPREQMAGACVLYITAWENLRYVHGEAANLLGIQAYYMISELP